ncbi:MAG: type I-MYXAN CRISPR-associated protein Cas6/Cmx6 [Betaproteobacteria bacterium]
MDAVFAISCRSLPVDHAYALSQAIEAALPWFAQEPHAGLHLIHGASSGSGWMRPEAPDALLYLSQRTRLALRLPSHRLHDAAALLGRTMDVAGCPLRVEGLGVRTLSGIANLFARGVLFDAAGNEGDFLAAANAELATLGIRPAEILCGRSTTIATPARVYEARSLMLAGLARDQSLALQQHGLGAGRKLGCGLFIPHKDIGDLASRSDND